MDSPDIPNSPAPSTARSPWQFSLRKLLGLVTAFAIWCAIAGWSLAWAIVVGLTVIYLAVLIVCDRRRSFTFVGWFLTLCPAGYILYHVPRILRHLPTSVREEDIIYETTFTLEVLVKDANTRQPLVNVPVEWWANGTSMDGNTSLTGTHSIFVSGPAKRRDAGWGRSGSEVELSDISVFVSMPDYEATHVNWAHQTRKSKWIFTDSSPLTMEVLLKPLPPGADVDLTAPDAESALMDSH
jgi:hypothetical protein